jgi:hypothetical protein
LTTLLKDFEDLNQQSNQQQTQLPLSTQHQSQSHMQAQTTQVGTTQTSASNQQTQSLNSASALNTNSSSLEQKQTPEQQSTQQMQQQSIEAFGISPTSSSRIKRKQFVAMIILGLIGAEFGQDVNSSNSQGPYKTIPQGFSMEDHSILKRISKKSTVYLINLAILLNSFFVFPFTKALLFQTWSQIRIFSTI